MEPQAQEKRILVVDDEPHVQEALRQLAAWGGFVADSASSGEEALARLAAQRFDVVVTDNRMAGISGVELAKAIKARWPLLPVVMFTAYPPAETSDSIDLLLLKPTDGLILIKSLKEMLHGTSGRNPSADPAGVKPVR